MGFTPEQIKGRMFFHIYASEQLCFLLAKELKRLRAFLWCL